jgi:putative membrane protein
MTALLIRVAIVAAALLLAALLVPDIEIAWTDEAESVGLTLLLLAVAFGLVNAFIRPIAKLASIPLNVLSLGLFSVVLNAALLLLVAFLVETAFGPLIVIGGFPPDVGPEAVAAAAIGSFVISAVSTGLTILIPDA